MDRFLFAKRYLWYRQLLCNNCEPKGENYEKKHFIGNFDFAGDDILFYRIIRIFKGETEL